MKLDVLKNPMVKKGLGVASVIFTGTVAMMNAISDRNREIEFNELKKAVADLQKNK